MSKKFSIEAIFKARDFLTKPIGKIRSELKGLGAAGASALNGVNAAVDRSLKGIGKFSSALGIAGAVSAAGLVYQLQQAMTTGAELEKILVRTGSAFEKPVRIGTKGFEELNAAVRGIGKTTEFGAIEAAEGVNSLATAGYTMAQSIAALPKIIDFASAATLELGQASDITSDTLGAFSLRTTDATQNAANMARVMDVLTRAAADSTTNVGELFEGIRSGAAFSASAGASLEQYAALQGILANKGIKGAEAGTAIRNAYLHLTTQTKQASQAMARLGVKVAKTRDGKIDMIGTIARFTKATSKLTATQKNAAIATIFGSFAMGPFISLMDAGAGAVGDFTKNLENATGVTHEMAAAARQSAAAKIQRFFNIISDVRLTVFEAIAPAVLDIANAVQEWVTANEKLIATKAGEWAAELRDNLPEIAMWAERAAKAFAGFLILSGIVKTLTLLTTVIQGLSIAWAYLNVVAFLTGASIAAVVGWVVLIGVAIAALVALVYTYWPQISAFFVGLYEVAADAVTRLWDWIKSSFDTVKGYVTAIFEFMVGLLSIVFAPGIEAVKLYASLVGAWLSFVVDLVKTIWGPLGEWFSLFWDGIVATQRSYFDIVVGVWSGLIGFFTGIWDAIAGAFGRIIGPLIDKAAGIINVVRTAGRMALGTDDESEPASAGAGAPGASGAANVISPGDRAASAAAEAASANASVDGKITVEAKPGTKATVKARPGLVAIKPVASGAFAGAR